MARISLITDVTASAQVKAVMEEHQAKGYRITNMKRTLLHSVPSFRALEDGFYSLQERLETFLDKRTTAIFAYAISTEDDCIVCSTYFRDLLDKLDVDIETFAFSETENLLVKLGREIVANKGHVSDEVLDRLAAQFDEQQMVELTTFAGLMVANNLFNNVLRVESELL